MANLKIFARCPIGSYGDWLFEIMKKAPFVIGITTKLSVGLPKQEINRTDFYFEIPHDQRDEFLDILDEIENGEIF